MPSEPISQQSQQSRRVFAAKYQHRGWGWTALISGVLAVFGTISDLVAPAPGSTTQPVDLVFPLGLVLAGIYLLRGAGVSPRQAEKNKRKAALAADSVQSAVDELNAARGGAAVVAYRNLQATVRKFHKSDSETTFQELLASNGFDVARIQSPTLGTLRTTGLDQIEVFQDWIIYGQSAYDVDMSTRGEVHLDGAIQVGADRKKHDLRTAQLIFVSSSWSLTVAIRPDDVTAARRIVSQLALVTDAMKPTAATAADIATMVQAILTNTGQPPAERIEQLNALRFQRLLSDEEFEAAKARVLGI